MDSTLTVSPICTCAVVSANLAVSSATITSFSTALGGKFASGITPESLVASMDVTGIVIFSEPSKEVAVPVAAPLNAIVLKVIDPSTDKVIKEIPSREVQQMQIRIRETIGFLFDEFV